MEIIQWCLQNEVHISSGILSKFIILLVSYESDVKDVKPKKTINVNSYKFWNYKNEWMYILAV